MNIYSLCSITLLYIIWAEAKVTGLKFWPITASFEFWRQNQESILASIHALGKLYGREKIAGRECFRNQGHLV